MLDSWEVSIDTLAEILLDNDKRTNIVQFFFCRNWCDSVTQSHTIGIYSNNLLL